MKRRYPLSSWFFSFNFSVIVLLLHSAVWFMSADSFYLLILLCVCEYWNRDWDVVFHAVTHTFFGHVFEWIVTFAGNREFLISHWLQLLAKFERSTKNSEMGTRLWRRNVKTARVCQFVDLLGLKYTLIKISISECLCSEWQVVSIFKIYTTFWHSVYVTSKFYRYSDLFRQKQRQFLTYMSWVMVLFNLNWQKQNLVSLFMCKRSNKTKG